MNDPTPILRARRPEKPATDAPVNLPWYRWFHKDFHSSTRGWPVTARGVYRELLDVAWDRGALPAEPAELCVLIGATAAEWAMAWALVEKKFPVNADGLRRNPRMEFHRRDAIEEYHKRRAGAKVTNTKRWGKR